MQRGGSSNVSAHYPSPYLEAAAQPLLAAGGVAIRLALGAAGLGMLLYNSKNLQPHEESGWEVVFNHGMQPTRQGDAH